ncbi:MAG: hypothetical protein NZM04_00925 [Methylacidiphilales bacterium]|nr:hypothetical protein [Candidatus Methylacidiphilales bacterium]
MTPHLLPIHHPTAPQPPHPISPQHILLSLLLTLTPLPPITTTAQSPSPHSTSPPPTTPHAFLNHFVNQSPTIQIASQQIISHFGQLIQWKASLFPRLSAQAISFPLLIDAHIHHSLLDLPTQARTRATLHHLEAAEFNLLATAENEFHLLRQATTQYLAAQHLTRIESSFADLFLSHLHTLRSLRDAARIPTYDLTWAESQAHSLQLSLHEAQISLYRAQAQLETITSQPIHRLPRTLLDRLAALPTDTPPTHSPYPPSPPPWHARPAYKKILALLKAADTEILALEYSHLPTLHAFTRLETAPDLPPPIQSLSPSQDENEPSNRRSPSQSRLALGTRLHWLIWDGRDRAGALHSARASRTQATHFLTHWENHYHRSWRHAHSTLTTTAQSLRRLHHQARTLHLTPPFHPISRQLHDGLITHRQYLDHLLLARQHALHTLHLKTLHAQARLTLDTLAGRLITLTYKRSSSPPIHPTLSASHPTTTPTQPTP